MRMLRRPEKIMDEEAEVLSSDFVFSLRDNAANQPRSFLRRLN